ncbi:MAG: type II toxin-antitoxin system RelE/ParE family toxin [Candidatus Riflebacteria bacterium]|nr:type II toxin-antitoxin system RelE/ParE family toxin [Candidatus Riflebacteria bacterium]
MSYFDDYFNPDGERTLRSYSVPLKLTDGVYRGWRTAAEDLDPIGDRLEAIPHYQVVTAAQEANLPPVDRRLLAAGLLGARIDGLSQNPRPPGVKKLAGEEHLCRIRVGDHRVVHEIQDDRLLVLVVRIGHRRDVYR